MKLSLRMKIKRWRQSLSRKYHEALRRMRVAYLVLLQGYAESTLKIFAEGAQREELAWGYRVSPHVPKQFEEMEKKSMHAQVLRDLAQQLERYLYIEEVQGFDSFDGPYVETRVAFQFFQHASQRGHKPLTRRF